MILLPIVSKSGDGIIFLIDTVGMISILSPLLISFWYCVTLLPRKELKEIVFTLNNLDIIYRDEKSCISKPIISLDLLEIAKKFIEKKDGRKKADLEDDSKVENYKLSTIYKYYFDDYQEDKAHTSDYDVYMLERIYNKFIELKFIQEDTALDRLSEETDQNIEEANELLKKDIYIKSIEEE